MKRTILFIFLFLFSLSFCAAQDYPVAASPAMRDKNPDIIFPISVNYPSENENLGNIKNTFLFGAIYNPAAKLTINGVNVPVHKHGGFITFLPVEKGEFTFVLETNLNGVIHTAARKIKTTGFDARKYRDRAGFDQSCLMPSKEIWIKPGEDVNLTACGTPGAQVTYTIDSFKNAKKITMAEIEPGVYKAKHTLLPKDSAKAARITFNMTDAASETKARAYASGRVRVLKEKDLPVTGLVRAEDLRLRKIPVKGGEQYQFYNLRGRLFIDGKENGFYSVMLDEKNKGWLEENKIKLNKEKHFPKNIISEVKTEISENKTKIIFNGKRKVPVTTVQKNGNFFLTFFYTTEFGGKYNYDLSEDVLADNISETFLSPETLQFKIALKQGQIVWGYEYDFDNSGNFILTLFHRPPPPDISNKEKPLTGAKVFLDPGHSPKRTAPYDGTVSALGVFEYEMNYTFAEELKEKLQNAGAAVFLSKTPEEQLNHTKRKTRAVAAGADIFISLHLNALPANVNPFAEERGIEVYYFTDNSMSLAEAMLSGMSKYNPFNSAKIKIGNFAVIRMTQMPAIIIESAFPMIPEHEEVVVTPEKRAKLIQGIYEGILKFYGVEIKEEVKKPAPKQKKKPARKLIRKKTKKK